VEWMTTARLLGSSKIITESSVTVNVNVSKKARWTLYSPCLPCCVCDRPSAVMIIPQSIASASLPILQMA